MMIKQFSANGWDFGEPVVQQIKISNDGLIGHDRKAFVKRAGAASEPFLAILNNMKRAGDEELLHLIALGATERWGPNRNGDGFDKKGSLSYHDTFVKLARWYRNHQNKDPRQSYGLVKASAWQPDMWRIDLIVGLNKTAAAAERNGGYVADRELQKLARTGSLSVSMACRIDNDECSWCGNRARSRDEYCTKESCAAGGCRDNLAKLVKVAGELHHLHVNNPRPQYFDISDVYRNADRTAHAYPVDYVKAAACDQLFKYAEEHGGVFDAVGGAATAEMLGLMPAMAVQFHDQDPACLWAPRVANQIKLARVLAEWQPEEPPDAWRLFDAAQRPELPPLPGGLKVGEFLAALAERTVVLPFTEFARLTKRAELAAVAAAAVPGALSRMQSDGTLERALERNPYVPDDGPVSEAGRKIAALVSPYYGLSRRDAFRRAADSAVRDAPQLKTSFGKTAGAADFPEAERLARDYACYQVASLCKIAEHDDQFTLTCRLSTCQNQYS